MLTFEPTEILARRMARLNAANVRFDIGAGGGVPALTAQDIAAALGMVPAGLGLELLLAVNWPDAAKRNRKRLLELLTVVQLREHNDREQGMFRALCQVATAEPRDKQRATAAYSAAHMARWPQIVVKNEPLTFAGPYEAIRLAVIEELVHPRQCPECRGRELRDRVGQPKTCDRCLGSGVVQYGSTWRAKRLGKTRATFIQSWKPAYDWLMDVCRAHLAEAESELFRRLR
ncbi:hypothetical protein ACQKIE_01055 [Luteibacter sp. NPDC031894]|uniref:hypothetical protein n=1 Tax=Luteibacter sp. NPDC031894 TaxID=3390572 RepID=UPI003D07669E